MSQVDFGVGKLNIAELRGKRYFFVPTDKYHECPHCHVLCEIQAFCYGHYCEGPGYVCFPDLPNILRCPSCLQKITCLPKPITDYPAIALWECKGDEVLSLE